MSSVLNVIITDAGIAEVVNAQHTGTAPVVLTQVGFGRGIYTPTASQTALHDEIKRVSTIAGGVVGSNIMHIQALDSGESAYAIYEIGIYTASGTLFAVYSQPLPILHKVANSSIMCVIDFVLSGVEPTDVTVGDTNYTLAPATTTNSGVVELATDDEAIAGTDTERAITPAAGAAAYVSAVNNQTVGGNKVFSDTVTFNGATKLWGGISGTEIAGATCTGDLKIEDSDLDVYSGGSIYVTAGNVKKIKMGPDGKITAESDIKTTSGKLVGDLNGRIPYPESSAFNPPLGCIFLAFLRYRSGTGNVATDLGDVIDMDAPDATRKFNMYVTRITLPSGSTAPAVSMGRSITTGGKYVLLSDITGVSTSADAVALVMCIQE